MTAPPTEIHTIALRDGNELDFTGRELGYASSHREEHTHGAAPYAARGIPCKACRWIDLHIYRVEGINGVYNPDMAVAPDDGLEKPEGEYLVYTVGRSEVPGEIQMIRLFWTDKGSTVVKACVYKGRLDGVNREVVQAAAVHDPEIAKALQMW